MRTFIANFTSLVAGNVLALATNFVFSILLVQRLSPTEYGLQSAIVAFASIIVGFADLGLLDVGTRDLARQSHDEQRVSYSSLLTLQLAVSGAVCLVAVVAARLMNSFPGDNFPIFLLGIFTLVLSYAPIIPTEALLTVRGKVRRVAVLQSFYAVGTIALGAPILLTGGGIGLIYVALSLLSVVSIVLYMAQANGLLSGGFRLTLSRARWTYYLRQGLPVGLAATLFSSCLRLGTYLVFAFGGEKEAGYLGVANLLIQAVMSIVWVPYVINIFPIMARLHVSSPEQLKWLGGRSVTWLAAIILPITVGATLLAPELVEILSAAQVAAAPVVRVLIWALPLSVVSTFLYRMLLVFSRQKTYLAAAAVGAVSNLLLCLVLIPRLGAIGAAIASLFGLSCVLLIALWSVRAWLFASLRVFDALRIALGVAAMVVVVEWASPLPVVIRIGIGAVVYAILVVTSRLVTSTDWHQFRLLQAGASTASAAQK
ncbi:MAG TPA: polysaccharide biosynthesis C-terminal domain-containing protein [Aggregatilineales bacterium]|nr:polysaccharide biosynthesis C-terminal domain-containing protein [Aggregatilineales bacterium]